MYSEQFGADPIRGFNEPVFVDLAVCCQAADQTDVRTLRSLNRTDSAVMTVMHVANFEARAVTAQATRTKSREATLVRQLSQRVGLVHEL